MHILTLARPLAVALTAAFVSSLAAAQTCISNGTTQVCLSWSAAGNPVQGTDFSALASGSTFTIVLHTGDPGWDLVATQVGSGAPGDLGQVFVLPITPNEDFGVSFGGGVTPGARDVAGIDLTAASWNGASDVTGGLLSGSLGGGIQLTADSPSSGGAITGAFTVAGKTAGTVTLRAVEAPLALQGPVSATGSIGSVLASTAFGEVTGQLTVGDVSGTDLIVDGVSGVLDLAALKNGFLNIVDGVSSKAKIFVRDLSGTAQVEFNDFGGTAEHAGYLGVYGGIDTNQIVQLWMPVAATGVVDLAHGDIYGVLELVAGGAGKVVDAGVVRTNGHVWLSETLAYTFSGEATFDAIEPFGIVEAEFSTIDGLVHVLGDCDGTLVVRYGDLLGNGRFVVDGDLGPQGWIGPIGSPGAAGDLFGQIEIFGDAAGWISVDESMQAGSRITVHGTCDAALRVQEATLFGSEIRLRHLGAAGRIYVNDSGGANDADGLIYVGPLDTTTLLPVVFDGCVRIRDDGAGNGGDLNGRIAVRGCHATPDDLDICIDGTLNGGVLLLQGGCPTQVTWSCVGNCL